MVASRRRVNPPTGLAPRDAQLRVIRPRLAVLAAVHAHPHADTDSIFGAVRGQLSTVSQQAVYDEIPGRRQLPTQRRHGLLPVVQREKGGHRAEGVGQQHAGATGRTFRPVVTMVRETGGVRSERATTSSAVARV